MDKLLENMKTSTTEGKFQNIYSPNTVDKHVKRTPFVDKNVKFSCMNRSLVLYQN
ncbi:hypothetical protein C874_13510 [Elizabethkingia anophelis 502]|nr:hypothetical protein C874_13510 [Elizabethkingia anophelis 502]